VTSHTEAKRIVERAVPGISPALSLLTRGISVIEAQYGDGWGHGLSEAGQGSNNWGAMTAGSSWTGPTFEHRDSRWDEASQQQVPYVTRFRSYATPEAGAADLARTLSTGYHAVAGQLAEQGRWSDISAAIGPEGTYYYGGFGPPEQAVADHQQRFLNALAAIRAETGEPLPMPSSSSSKRQRGGGMFLIVSLAGLTGLFALGRKRRA
jgi:hypothetical protein